VAKVSSNLNFWSKGTTTKMQKMMFFLFWWFKKSKPDSLYILKAGPELNRQAFGIVAKVSSNLSVWSKGTRQA